LGISGLDGQYLYDLYAKRPGMEIILGENEFCYFKYCSISLFSFFVNFSERETNCILFKDGPYLFASFCICKYLLY